MKTKAKQGKPTPTRGNNPFAGRFDHVSPKEPGRFPRVAFVLQGGGALGAYQLGVVKGLVQAGYEPDWIAATSIGAIQAAIFVGNQPEKRIAKLEEFWSRVAPPAIFDLLGNEEANHHLYIAAAELRALLFGQPEFFYPRWCAEALSVESDPTMLSYYDTSPLKNTLLDLIDFDLLNASPIRLSLGAVQISSGHLIYFNNINYQIGPEHIMASAALPPGFPAVKVDNEYYWDGGVHSNTPLEVILEAVPVEDTLCFLIDCFGGAPFVPKTMNEVEERIKDIRHSTHAQRAILNYLQRQKMRQCMAQVSQILTSKQKKEHAHLLDIGIPHHCTLVHVIYSARLVKKASKDYNFGHAITNKRIQLGYQDVQGILENESEWGFLPKDGQSRLYSTTDNFSRLLRKHKGISKT